MHRDTSCMRKRRSLGPYSSPMPFLMSDVPLHHSVGYDTFVASNSGGCRGTALIRNTPLLGPYIRTIPRVLWWSWGGGCFL